MNSKNTSTFKFRSELVFNDIVTFCENAVFIEGLMLQKKLQSYFTILNHLILKLFMK